VHDTALGWRFTNPLFTAADKKLAASGGSESGGLDGTAGWTPPARVPAR